MSLTTRRLMQKINEAAVAANAALTEKTGFAIPIAVDEASFPEDEEVLKDVMMHEIYGLSCIVNAVAAVAVDELGKEAVTAEIKSIKLINTATSFTDKGSKSIELKKGELQVRCAFSEGSDNLYRPDELANAIEKLL